MNDPRQGTSRNAAFSTLSRTSEETYIIALEFFGTSIDGLDAMQRSICVSLFGSNSPNDPHSSLASKVQKDHQRTQRMLGVLLSFFGAATTVGHSNTRISRTPFEWRPPTCKHRLSNRASITLIGPMHQHGCIAREASVRAKNRRAPVGHDRAELAKINKFMLITLQ